MCIFSFFFYIDCWPVYLMLLSPVFYELIMLSLIKQELYKYVTVHPWSVTETCLNKNAMKSHHVLRNNFTHGIKTKLFNMWFSKNKFCDETIFYFLVITLALLKMQYLEVMSSIVHVCYKNLSKCKNDLRKYKLKFLQICDTWHAKNNLIHSECLN